MGEESPATSYASVQAGDGLPAVVQEVGPAPVVLEQDLVQALRRGDEAAFIAVVRQHHVAMVNVARVYLGHRDLAEEVAQETWLAVIEAIHRFEGRSTLKSWIFTVLTNKAKRRAAQENRTIDLAAVEAGGGRGGDGRDRESSLRADPSAARGIWMASSFEDAATPERRVLSGEIRDLLEGAIDALPATQRLVITLRDIHGWKSKEVAGLLGLAPGSERVLLHRARVKIREILGPYLREGRR
jgi:RNA polymerase sigma-70 factor (ECF subfamily)